MFRSYRVLFSAICVIPCGDAVAFEDAPGKGRSWAAYATVDRCVKVEPPPEVPELPGGDIFGFLSPTDIGDPCSYAYAAEYTARTGKRDGRYATVTKKSQFAYTYSDRLSFAASPFVSAFDWKEVTINRGALLNTGEGMDHASHRILDFDGLSAEASWRVLARAANQPVAITLSTEPRWFRRDAVTGFRVEGHQIEAKLLADVAVTERLFAAVNVIYGVGAQKFDVPVAELQKGSALGVLSALTWQPYKGEGGAIQGVFVGLEARYVTGFSGLTLNFMVGEALFGGPTLAIGFSNGAMLNVAWSPQVWGRGQAPSAPGRLELDALERHQFRFKLATPLPF
jgi:hypothetical protein